MELAIRSDTICKQQGLLSFLYVVYSVYNMFHFLLCPSSGTYNIIMMLEKMFSCSQSQSGLLSLHLFTRTSKDDSYSPTYISWSQSFLFCVFSHHFLRDNKLLSCVTTVLTQCDSTGVTFFWIFPFCNVAFTPQKDIVNIVFRHVKQNGLIRMAGYHYTFHFLFRVQRFFLTSLQFVDCVGTD